MTNLEISEKSKRSILFHADRRNFRKRFFGLGVISDDNWCDHLIMITASRKIVQSTGPMRWELKPQALNSALSLHVIPDSEHTDCVKDFS